MGMVCYHLSEKAMEYECMYLYLFAYSFKKQN